MAMQARLVRRREIAGAAKATLRDDGRALAGFMDAQPDLVVDTRIRSGRMAERALGKSRSRNGQGCTQWKDKCRHSDLEGSNRKGMAL
jgi:hypothetical protein